MATLSISCGISMRSRNTKKRMTVKIARMLDRKVLTFSFLIQQKMVRPYRPERGFTM